MEKKLSNTGHHNILIGDVGGTNVRLQLIRIYNNNIDKKNVLKELTKYKT
jgi:glucokinase